MLMTLSTPPAPPHVEDFVRALFESAREDEVPDTSRRRVARALGIAPGVPLGGALEPELVASTGRSGAPAGVSTAAIAAGQGKLALLGKAALVGLAAGTVALGVAFFDGSSPVAVGTTAPPAVANPAPTPALESTQVVPELGVPSQPTGLAANALDDARAARKVVPLSPRGASKRAKPIAATATDSASAVDAVSADSSRLLAEVRRLDAARNALATGNATQALSELERYEREFPDGTLALDAALLEVRALDRTGQGAAAHRRARQLMSRPGAERHHAELEAIVNPLASGSKARRRDIDEAR
jgi:hypothetical protein